MNDSACENANHKLYCIVVSAFIGNHMQNYTMQQHNNIAAYCTYQSGIPSSCIAANGRVCRV